MTGQKRALAVAALVVVAGPAIAASEAAEPSAFHRWVEERLSAALDGEVRFGTLTVDITGLAAEFEDASLVLRAAQAPPLRVTARSGRFTLAWSGIAALAGGRVRFSEIVLREPAVEMNRDFLDARKRRTRDRPVDVEFGRVRVEDGRFRYLDASSQLDLDLTGVELDAVWNSYRRALEGTGSCRGTVLRPPIVKPLPFEARGTVRYSRRAFELEAMRFEGPGAQGSFSGRASLGDESSFHGQGRITAEAGAIAPWFGPTFPEIGGRLEGTVVVDRSADGSFVVNGRGSASGARIGPVRADRAEADYRFSPGRLELRGLQAAAYGGRVSGDVDVDLEDPVRFTTRLEGTDVNAAGILDLARLPFPVSARVRGGFRVEGLPGDPSTWKGEAPFVATAQPSPSGRIPTHAAGTIRFEGGRVVLQKASVEMAETRLVVDVDVSLTGGPPSGVVVLSGKTDSAAAARETTLAFTDALDITLPDVVRESISGHGAVSAVIGLGEARRLTLELDLAEGGWSGMTFERARFSMDVDAAWVRITRLDVVRGPSRLEGSASFESATGAIASLDASWERVELAPVLTRFGAKVEADGRVSGSLRASRVHGRLFGLGQAFVEEALVWGEPLDRVVADLTVEGSLLTAGLLTAKGPALEASGSVRVDLASGAFDGRIDRAAVEPSALASAKELGVRLDGRIALRGVIGWTAEGPTGRIEISSSGLAVPSPGLAIPRLELGAAMGSVVVDPSRLILTLRSVTSESWAVEAEIGLTADAPLRATVSLDVLGDEMVGVEGAVGVRLGGGATFKGPLARPRQIELDGRIDRGIVRVGRRELETIEAVPFAMEGGVLRVGPGRLIGDMTVVEAALSYELETDGLEGSLVSSVDTSILSAFWSDLRASGAADADVTLGGTAREPKITGRVRVEDGTARILGVPQPFDHIQVAVDFDGAAATASYSALSGGGEIRGEGTFRVGGGLYERLDAELRLASVTVAYPEGFRGTYDGRLTISGSSEQTRVEGRIDLVRGLYDEDINVTGLLGAAGRETEPESEGPVAGRVSLDVRIAADGNVWVKNNVAKLESRADLVLGGTLARPEVEGRFTLFEGGRVRFRDVEYRIDAGTVDMVSTEPFNPVLDVRSSTRVQSYDVGLHVQGRLDRLRYELTSTPTLSEQDIVTLLLTGRVPQTDGGTLYDARSVTGDLAAGYFAGILTSRLGGELQRVLGLERFEIDPLVNEGADPTARVTIGKRVGEKVRLIYSTDLGTTDRQFYQAEWEVSRKLRLSVEQDTVTGVGGDVTYTDRFRGPPRTTGALREAAPGPHPTVDSVVVQFPDPSRVADLAELLPVRAGDPYTRPRLFDGVDALRAALIKDGFLEAKIVPEVREIEGAPFPGAVQILYRVDPGPRIDVSVVASSGKLPRGLDRQLRTFWVESFGNADIYVEAEDHILRSLRQRGHYAADVEHDVSTGDGTARVLFRVDAGPKVSVRDVDIEGVAALPLRRVRAQMLTRADSLFGGETFDPDVLDEDLRAIRTLYRNEGYLGVVIRPPVVRLSTDGTGVDVTIRVEEGPRFLVADVAVPENTPLPAATLRAWAGLRPGDLFTPIALKEAENRLRSEIDRAGYPDATVESGYTLDAGRVHVRLDVRTGSLARVATVEIAGNGRTKDKIILRELPFQAGDTLSRERMIQGEQAVYRLGLFRKVDITALPAPGGESFDRVVRVEVEEAAPVGFRIGLGYESEGGPRGSFSVSHDNVGGAGRSLALQGRLSGLEKRIQIVGREPRVFGRRLVGLGAFSWEQLDKDGFTEERRSTSARIDWRLSKRWTQYLRYSFDRVDLTDVSDVLAVLREKLNNLRLGDVSVAFTRDTRDDPFQPRRGGLVGAEIELFAKPFLSDAEFTKLFVQGTWTRTFRRRSSYGIWLRLGAEKGFGDTDVVPISERFFAGGISSLRGFPRDGVGPKLAALFPPGVLDPGDEDIPIGGEALILLNQEWRFPIWRAIRGVLFYDAGNVYFRLRDVDVSDIRHAAGTGVWIDTPVGAVRIEYGWKLDREPGESTGELHFSIGAVF